MNNILTKTVMLKTIKLPKWADKEGTFTLKLIEKAWGNHINMILIFQTLEDDIFAISIWRKWGGETYSPKYSDIDFRDVEKGTYWKCNLRMTKNKHISLDSAERVYL